MRAEAFSGGFPGTREIEDHLEEQMYWEAGKTDLIPSSEASDQNRVALSYVRKETMTEGVLRILFSGRSKVDRSCVFFSQPGKNDSLS